MNLPNLSRASRKMKSRGGQGDGISAVVFGQPVTIRESVATTIAKDAIKDAERRHKKSLTQLSMLELAFGLDERCSGRMVYPQEVAAEIARIQNAALYPAR